MRNEINVGKDSLKRTLTPLRLLALLVAGILATSVAYAEVPSTMSYQGRLTTPAGVPVADGTYSIAFRIYDDSTGGNLLWEEVKSVTTKGGLFSVQLGETNPLNQSTFSNPNLFLAIQIGAGAESSPRTRFNVVPYAARVGTVDGATAGQLTGKLIIDGLGQTTAIAAGGERYGGAFGALNLSDSSAGVYGVFSSIGTGFDPAGIKGVSTPSDGFGIGGDFKGGYIGCKGAIKVPMGSTAEHYGLYGSVIDNASFGSNYGIYSEAIGGKYNYGVYAYGINSGSGPTAQAFGIYATAMQNGGYGGWAGYFNGWTTCNGTLEVLGTLIKPAGAFRIDHPLDPENKYLQHSFVESPDMKNIYDGIVVLDANGDATVQMADWFEALNKDFRYQLTAIGASAPGLYIAKKVENNQFTISGGKPGMEVSWTITGIRHDAFANANRIQVEVPKDNGKAGTYLYPELFGMPKSMGETYEITKHAEEMEKRTEHDRGRMAAKGAAGVPRK